MIERLGIDEHSVVLDFGCGPGFYTIPFAKTAKEVVAVDLQPKMLEKVSRKALNQGLKIQTLQSDGKQIPLPNNAFDLIFLNHVYHEIRDKRTVLKELGRLLKPDGRLAIIENTKKMILGPPAMDPNEIHGELRTVGFAYTKAMDVRRGCLIIASNSP